MIIKYDVPEHLINKFISKTEEQQQEIITNALASNVDILLKMSLDMRIEQLDTRAELIGKILALEDKIGSGTIIQNTQKESVAPALPSFEPKMVINENSNNSNNSDDEDDDFFG